MNLHSRNAISLISRAIDTLTFRWDEAKGISRDTKLPLDGRDRVHCLMRVAYHTDTPLVNEQRALDLVREQLDLLRWENLDARQVLLETARFYGIFTPTVAGEWEFVHKTLYDYLGARFWVEVGKFNPAEVKQWTAKAAYAACLTADATESMKACLRGKETLPMFAEMLSNDAPFDHASIGATGSGFYLNAPSHCRGQHEKSRPRAAYPPKRLRHGHEQTGSVPAAC